MELRGGRALASGIVLGAAGILALEGGAARGQQTPGLIKGGGSAGVEKEPTFRFQTSDGKPAASDCDRNLLRVPASYGEPFAVCQLAGPPARRVAIWYRADDGSVRNVILSDDQMLVRIQPQ